MAMTKCGGKKHQGDGVCALPAGWGTDHAGHGRCKLHGGATPTHQQAAIASQATAQLVRLNLPPVDDPLSALASVTAEVLAWKDQIAAKVNDLTSLRYSTEGGEQLRAEVALWERALDRCERFLTAMARLNIDERLAAIAEAQAQVIMDAIRIGLEAAGVDAGQRKVALAAVKDHLAA
jgi:hypothetical protein